MLEAVSGVNQVGKEEYILIEDIKHLFCAENIKEH